MTIEISVAQLKSVVKTVKAAKPDLSHMQVLHQVAQVLGYKSFEALSAVAARPSKTNLPISWWTAQDLGFLVYALCNNESFFWVDFQTKRPYRLLAAECAFSKNTFIQWFFGIDRLLSDEGLYSDLFSIEEPPFGFEAVGDVSDFENVYSAELCGLKVVQEGKKIHLLFDNKATKDAIIESAMPYSICLSDLQTSNDELVALVIQNLPELTAYKQKCEAWARTCFNEKQVKHPLQIIPADAQVIDIIYRLTGLKLDSSFEWASLPDSINHIIDQAS